MKLSLRQKNAVLAGLRLLQSFQQNSAPADNVFVAAIREITTNCGTAKPLSDAEIDQLCMALNSPTTAELEDTLRDIHGARKPMGYKGTD
jgi:hypothetical protein